MSKMNDINPCKNCDKRDQNCHANCVKYKIFKGILHEEARKKKEYDEKHKCYTGMVIK